MSDNTKVKIPGFQYYEADIHGNIYSLPRCGTKGGKLNMWLDKHGYFRVSIWENGKPYQKTVHRLIAIAFIENPLNKPVVNHKNGIKTDNSLSNLEWCTISENTKHSYLIGTSISPSKGKTGYSSYCGVEVMKLDLNGNYLATYGSIYDAARDINGRASCISMCLSGKIKTSGGFIWERK